MEERHGLTIKGFLLRLILIILFIFLLIWLFPTPDLKPLNNQIFGDNLDRMKNVAKTYYTVDRLPKNINDSKRMTLEEMINNKLILPLMDSNGKYCSEKDSYVEITKLENEYIIKVYLSCTDKQDYIIEHFGCYDICSDKCKLLETTTTTLSSKKTTTLTKKVTTKKKTTTEKTTTKEKVAYEYKYSKNDCKEVFDKYSCEKYGKDYKLQGDTCIKNGAQTITKPAIVVNTNVTSTDKQPIDIISKTTTSTDSKPIDIISTKKEDLVNATLKNKITESTITATKKTKLEIKGAIASTPITYSDYIITQNYDVITATKIATTVGWKYDYTLVDTKAGLSYTNASEKLVLVDSWEELTCATCFTTVKKYKYYHYVKGSTTYSYNCDKFPGYSLYNEKYCRKATTKTKTCPAGYDDNGSKCQKKGTTTYSCSTYGKEYVLDSSKKTCTKSTVTYSCPANTSNTTYTLNGSLCNVKKTEQVYDCGSLKTSQDKTKCIKETTVNTKSCDKYGKDYKLTDNACVKTTTNTVNTKSCDKYGKDYKLTDSACVKTTTKVVSNKSCSSYGSNYTLVGNNCVATVKSSDSKPAVKLNKKSCETLYMWSTKTSVDGWDYTGIKRKLTK